MPPSVEPVAIAHIVVLSAALLTLLFLPCLVAAVLCADGVVPGRAWPVPGRARPGGDDRALRRVDRALRGDAEIPPPSEWEGPPFEVIACDLRRLGHQRVTGLNLGSVKWQAAVLQAYDQRLSLACRCLGLDEPPGNPSKGMDRDLERLRVESALQAAGLALR